MMKEIATARISDIIKIAAATIFFNKTSLGFILKSLLLFTILVNDVKLEFPSNYL